MAAALCAAAVSCSPKDQALREAFADPSSEYRVTGALSLLPMRGFGQPQDTTFDKAVEIERIRKEIDSNVANGYGGADVSPSRHPFFTDDWFDLYRAAAEYSKEVGQHIVMYDDIEYPSGTAGDRIKDLYPELRVKLLTKTESEFSGPCRISGLSVPYEGELVGTVAFNPSTYERIDITDRLVGKELSWDVPEGDWKILTFSIVTRGRMIDLMSDEAVDKYIELMYDKYYKEIGTYFGNVIEENFFDDIGFWYMINPWNDTVTKTFEDRYGKSALMYMPALWYDMGEDTYAARRAFYNITAERLGDAFAKRLSDWCAKHNLKNMGHVPGAYEPNPTFMHGDPFKFYKYQQIPYIDLLSGYLEGRPGIKLTSSVATLYDRPVTGTEIFGAYSYLDGDMLYRVPMEATVRGINLYVSFAAGRTDYDGTSYREKNPFTSNSYIREWNDYMGRTATMLRGGRNVVDIALIYPVESLQAWSHYEEDIIEHEKQEAAKGGDLMFFGGVSPASAGGAVSNANFAGLDFSTLGKKVEFSLPSERKPGSGQDVYPSNDYNKISDLLTNQLRRDFTFVEADEFISDKFSIVDGKIKLNTENTWQEYKLVIMPSQFIVQTEMLKKLKSYYEAGGRILFTGEIPFKSVEFGRDGEVKTLVAELLGVSGQTTEKIVKTNAAGGQIVYLPKATVDGLTSAVDSILPDADVRISPVSFLKYEDLGDIVFGVDFYDNGGNLPDQYIGELSYTHKVNNGKDIYFFINSSNHPLSTTVRVAGRKNLEQWNPHNGEISQWNNVTYGKDEYGDYTEFSLELTPVTATFAVSR